MANPNPNKNNLRPVQKGEVRNPYGRPKRTFTQAKEYGFSKDDVTNCYKLYISKTVEELQEIAKDKEISILETIVIKSLITDLKEGKMDNIEKILNRAVGTPKNEITQTNLNVEVEQVTEEMQNELLNTLKRMIE
jgi:Glu-tRNA(Gln) amidotransferase subunit E-like FAD-binding protein